MSVDSTQGRAADAVRAWAAKLDELDYYEILRVPARDASGQPPTPEALRQAFNGFAGAFHPERYKGEAPAILEAATRIFRRGNEALRVLSHPQLRQKYDFERRTGVLRLSVDEIARASSTRIPVAEPAPGAATPAPAAAKSAPPTPRSAPPVARSLTPTARTPTPTPGSAPGSAPPVARTSSPSATPAPPAASSAPPVAGSCESLVTTATAMPFAKEADRMLARGAEKHALLQMRIALSKEPTNRKLAQRVDALAALLAGTKR
jgi:hypothetical protein